MGLRTVVAALTLCCAATACTGRYRAGSILRSADGRVLPNGRALRCVDVTVSELPPLPAQSASSPRLGFVFGNRCAWPTGLDFGAIAVDATFDDGRHERLEAVSTVRGAAIDGAALPLEPIAMSADASKGTLDAFGRGRQMILFASPTSTGRAPQHPLEAVCVDASRFEVGSSEPAAPVCFDASGQPAQAERPRETSYVPYEDTFSDEPPHTSTTSDFWRRRPPVSLGLGLSTHRLGLRGRTLSGGGSYGAPDKLPAEPLGSAQAESVDADFRWGVLGPMYLGGELQFGGSSVAHRAVPSPGFEIDGGGFYGAGGVLVGVDAPRIWQLTARAELFAGGWASAVHVGSSPTSGDCSTTECPEVAAWWLEPRARVDAWATPWVTLGAWAGAGLLEAGDWSAGVAIAIHGRSFDGSWQRAP